MRDKASIFVPSIGKVTIVVLLRNLLVSVEYPFLFFLSFLSSIGFM